MFSIKHLKIKYKLIAIILSITLLTLTIGFTSIIIYTQFALKKTLINEAETTARALGNNLISPISFKVPGQGNEELRAFMKGATSLKNVWVFDQEGTLFTSHHQADYECKTPIIITPPLTEFQDRYLHISRTVTWRKDFIGTIYLRISTEELTKMIERLIPQMIILFSAILIPLSLVLAAWLQGIISKPILGLVKITKKVSAEGNYSLRVRKTYNDEVGMLYDGFNDMLEQIHRRDIHRDRAENELKAAEFFLNGVMESMPSILISIDQKGKVTHWNKSAVQLTGLELHEAIGKDLWEILPGFIPYKSVINEISRTKKIVQFYKESIKIKGSTLYFNMTIFPLLDSQSSKFVFMANNVTEIELKEMQLRQSQKMETVGTLAGGLAHDFNNVLGGIIGTISLYKYKISKKKKVNQAELEKYFNTIEESANRASDMVQHLLSLTRKQELSFVPTDLNDIIKRTVKICGNTFDKGIEINARYSKKAAMTNADPTQLEQCLLNLCINSAHAMTLMRKEGEKYGGSLNISLEPLETDKYFLQLHPEKEDAEDYWVISVQDNGVGMSPDIVTKIYDPFFTTKTDGKGTGLGLAMAYNIIKQHEGIIEVYSQEGIGTTFHIYLPVLKHQIEEKNHKPRERIHRGEGLILVVDDEEIMRQTAKSIMEECGYRVMLASNGEEAVELYQEHYRDITAVLLDMVMPKMSGKQAYIELSRIKKEVKVLLASGFKRDSRVESILELGVKGFIQKPYALVKLANSIHDVINA